MPFLRFQLEKYIGLIPEKAVFKECAKLGFGNYPSRISETSREKRIARFFKVHKPTIQGEKKQIRQIQRFFPKILRFLGEPLHSKLHNQDSINIQQVLI